MIFNRLFLGILMIIFALFFWKTSDAKDTYLEPENTIFLAGYMTEQTAIDFIVDMERVLLDGQDDAYLVINSVGGDMMAYDIISDLIERYSSKIHIHSINIVSISAAYAVSQCTYRRHGIIGGQMMFHLLRTNPSGLPMMNVSELGVFASQMTEYQKKLIEKMKARNTLSQADFLKNTLMEKTYTAEEALAAGILDDIITVKCKKNFVRCELMFSKEEVKK